MSKLKLNYVTSLTDYDNNQYTTVILGSQEWTVQNLKVTHYADGTDISNITDATNWTNDTTGAYCWYNNDIGYKNPYGALYNWYAVNNAAGFVYFRRGNIQQTGWRVPTETDLSNLATLYISTHPLREVGTTHWDSPNTGATNATGFTAIGAGARWTAGAFSQFGSNMYIWSSTSFSSTQANMRSIQEYTSTWGNYTLDKFLGMSIRCVRDL